jgi:hypothetical protein
VSAAPRAKKLAILARKSDFLDNVFAAVTVLADHGIDKAFLLEACKMIHNASSTRSSTIPERDLDLISGYVSVLLAVGAAVVGIATLLH